MRPETVGAPQTQLVLGKHSGRHALSMRLRELGYELGKVELDRAFTAFKTLADKKKHIIDADLEALVSDEIRGDVVGFQLEALQVACGTIGMATATVRIVDPQGASHVRAAVGTGPIDAVYKAIDEVAHVELTLVEYSVRAITEGIDALGEVSVKVRAAGKVIHGHGADTDIVVASAKAYLAAVNRVVSMGEAAGGRGGRGFMKTLFEKVWDDHVVAAEPDAPSVLYVDLHLVHEVTSPQAFSGLRERGLKVRRPDKTVATMDHSIPTTPREGRVGRLVVADGEAAAQLTQLERNCAEFGIALHGMDSDKQGIVHVIAPELGLTRPGMTVVCGDSHTATHGAFGALASSALGTSQVEQVLATQTLLQRKPKTLEVRIDGVLLRRA